MRQYWMTMINDKRALLKYILSNEVVVLNVIKDRIAKLDPWKMQKLVAGLLTALGFQSIEKEKAWMVESMSLPSLGNL